MRWPEYRNNLEYEKIALDMLCQSCYFPEEGPAFPGWPRRYLTIDNKRIVKELFLNIEETESPDIQSNYLDLGIEVTIAIDEKIAKDVDTFNKAKAKVSDVREIDNYIRSNFQKKKFKREIRQVYDFGVLVDFDTTNVYDVLKNNIEKKIQKTFQKTYERFLHNWLFVFCPAHIEELDLLDCLDKISDLSRFSMYIICSFDRGSELWYIHDSYDKIIKRVHY